MKKLNTKVRNAELLNCVFYATHVTQLTIYYSSSFSSFSSSIGTTAHCGLWPVEQCPSIFSYLPPTMTTHFQPAPRYSRRALILPLHKFTLTSYAIKRSGQSRPLY